MDILFPEFEESSESSISSYDEITLDEEQDEKIIKCSLEEMAKAFFKDYEIIWHDPNVNSQENQQYLAQFEKICRVQVFTEWKEAEDYIKTAKTVCYVITSGTNGELLVKEIFSSQNVPNIFTFCRDKDHHSTWAKNYEKTLCIETKIEDVILQIQKNLLEWQKQTSSLKFDLPAFAPIFGEKDKGQMNQLHFHLIVVLFFKDRTQAKKDFVNLSRGVYSDKKNEKLIADFEQTYNNYNKDAILRWYTHQSFLYKIVNNCLRIATYDSIQWSRFLLKDIGRAIEDQCKTESKNFSGLLYRAAYLSEKEWVSLKENVNREIEMHGFLSVSKDKNVALKFIGLDPTQKVFITIILPECPTEEGQRFAEIEKFSKFPKEKEVLFNVRSRFTVLATEDQYSQEIPFRHLVLLYGAQSLRRFITDKNPFQQVSIQGIKNILCSRCQLPTGQMPEKILFMSIRDLEKRVYFCNNCLEEKAGPFLCLSVTKEIYHTNIKGCFLMKPNQIQIPFYGYQCSKCGGKKQKRYFACTDCGEAEKKWCQSCSNETLSCTQSKHTIILESYPFSFWCEGMREDELSHWEHDPEKAIEDYYSSVWQNKVTNSDDQFAVSFHNFGEVFMNQEKNDEELEFHNFGEIFMNQGKDKKALEFNQKSLDIKSLFSEGCGFQIAKSVHNIGYKSQKQGEYNLVLENYLKSLDFQKSVFGEIHPDIATSYNNLGLGYQDRGEYETALECHLKSLDISRSFNGETHPQLAPSYNNIGLIYQTQGDYEKAIEYYLESLNISESAYGGSHPLTATSLSNLGMVYSRQGEYEKALSYYLGSLDIYKSVHKEDHSDIATSYNNIAFIYDKLGDHSKTLEYSFKSLDIQKSIYREVHPDIATSYKNIGFVYNYHGDFKKALEYYFKALEIKKSIHGENHPSIATLYATIGFVYNNQGEDEKAFECHLKSQDIEKLAYRENYPSITASFSKIGSIYDKQGEYKKALEFYFKSLDTNKSLSQENHLDIAPFHHSIGLVFYNQGEYNMALEYYFLSLAIKESVFGENHPDIAILLHNIGLVFDAQREYEEALEYYFNPLRPGSFSKIT